MRSSLNQVLVQLREDRGSGNSEMTGSLLAQLRHFLSENGDLSREDWADFAMGLRACRPGMASFHNISLALSHVLQETDEEAWRRELGECVMQFTMDESEAGARICARASAVVKGNTFLTLSYSGTVMGTLLVLHRERGIRVLVAESLPLGEGRLTAEKLTRKGVPVELFPDSLMAAVIDRADACLVGADAVLPQGVLNKVGTQALATVCRAAGKPFQVLCSELKVAQLEEIDLGRGEELREGVKVVSQLFDLTPLHLVDDLITDKRHLSPGLLVWKNVTEL